MFELICNSRTEEAKHSDDSDQEVEDFDFGLKLFKQRAETDDLIVEREKKSYYRSTNNEEDGGDLQQTRGSDPLEKRFAYVWRTISLLLTSCKFSVSGREIGEDSPFLNLDRPFLLPESEVHVYNELATEDMIKENIIDGSYNTTTNEALERMYAHLCHNNDFVATELLNVILNDIKHPQTRFDEVIKHTPLL